MAKVTPRQELNELSKLNDECGYYGLHNQFYILIENRLREKATKIMKSLNTGLLWSNERLIHNTIFNYLLDGLTIKEIKLKFTC